MTDIVVSIRMPTSLVNELKNLSEINHYKDLSEEIRSIVRTKCLQYSQPYASELKKLRDDLSTQITVKKQQENKMRLIEDLQKIVEELKHEN